MTWILPESERLPSPNISKGRPGAPPDVLCLHYAVDRPQLEDEPEVAGSLSFAVRKPTDDAMDVARLFAKRSRKASAHFVVGRDGSKVQCVSLADRAWHAGGGAFRDDGIGPLVRPKRGAFNRRSIGIELSNVGWAVHKLRIPEDDWEYRAHPARPNVVRAWERYRDEQLATLDYLVAQIVLAMPGAITWVCGHEDVVNRDTLGKVGGKVDPGPAFPWDAIDWAGYGIVRVRYDFSAKAWVAA